MTVTAEAPGIQAAIPDLRGVPLGELTSVTMATALGRVLPDPEALPAPVAVPVPAFNSAI